MKLKCYFDLGTYEAYAISLNNVESIDEIKGVIDNIAKELCSKFDGEVVVRVNEVMQEIPIIPIAAQAKYSADEIMDFIIKVNSDVLTVGSIAVKEKEIYRKEYDCSEIKQQA